MTQPKAAALGGQLTAILTPFDAQGRLALEHMPALLDFQRQAGVTGVVVSGTNGEGTALSVAERKQVLETTLAHRGGLTVMAGTGATSVTDAVELTRHAGEAGADAALVLPPFFTKKPSARGLANYFLSVLDAASLPVLLYHIPQFTAVPITEELIELLAGHPRLAGIKDSEDNWEQTRRFLARYPNLCIFSGSDRLAAQGFAHGTTGCISGTANPFPELLVAVWNASQAEPGGPQAQAAQDRLNAAIAILSRYAHVSVSKSVLAHRGLPRLGMRPPLVSLTPELEETLIAELRAGGFLP